MQKRYSFIGTLLVILLTLAACGNPTATPPGATSVPATLPPATAVPATSVPATAVPATSGGTGGNTLAWLSVYFTDPNPPDQLDKGVDKVVIPYLTAARKSIDITSFDFTLPSVARALIDASKRGVKIRIIVDDKNGEQELAQDDLVKQFGGQPFQAVKDAGIPVVGGGRSNGLMHNKMMIIDSTYLIMGSWNMSYNDTFRNNNNLLIITNQKLIENYQAKFNEGFELKQFGAKAKVTSPNPKLSINGVEVEQYFSPDDHVMDHLIAEVNKAQKSVKFMIFTYTDKDLAAAMVTKFKAGLDVRGVIENRGASQGALVPLACAKVPVLTDGNKYTMHHKVIIIDDSTVITGSYNFTKSADDANDDNAMIIRSKTVANAYLAEFAKIYGQGKAPDTSGFTCS